MKCIFRNVYIKNPLDNKYIILYNAQSFLVVLKNMTFPLNKEAIREEPFTLTKPLQPESTLILGFTKQEFDFKSPVYHQAPMVDCNMNEYNAVLVLNNINQSSILKEYKVNFNILISAQRYNDVWKEGNELKLYSGSKMKFVEMYDYLFSSPSKILRLMYPILQTDVKSITGDSSYFLRELYRQTPLEGNELHYDFLIDNPFINLGDATQLQISLKVTADTFSQISDFMFDLSNEHLNFVDNLLAITYQDGNDRPHLISPEFFLFTMICLHNGNMVVLLSEGEKLYNLKQQLVNYQILYVYQENDHLFLIA